MASLHKQSGKPNWFCAYTTGEGVRHFKSTKTSDRKEAKEICRAWAQAALHGDKLTPDKAHEIIADGISSIMLATGGSLPSETFAGWSKRWLKTKELENEQSSHSLGQLKRSIFKEIMRDLVKDVHGLGLRRDVLDSKNKQQEAWRGLQLAEAEVLAG